MYRPGGITVNTSNQYQYKQLYYSGEKVVPTSGRSSCGVAR